MAHNLLSNILNAEIKIYQFFASILRELLKLNLKTRIYRNVVTEWY